MSTDVCEFRGNLVSEIYALLRAADRFLPLSPTFILRFGRIMQFCPRAHVRFSKAGPVNVSFVFVHRWSYIYSCKNAWEFESKKAFLIFVSYVTVCATHSLVIQRVTGSILYCITITHKISLRCINIASSVLLRLWLWLRLIVNNNNNNNNKRIINNN